MYLAASLRLFETYALNSKTIDWPQLRQQVYQQAQGARTISELLPLYPPLFAQLHDDHGWLTYQGKTGGHQKVWGSQGQQLLRLPWEAVLVGADHDSTTRYFPS